jgi:phosphoketolase
LGAKGDKLKEMMQNNLIAYRKYIDKKGIDLPEVRN